MSSPFHATHHVPVTEDSTTREKQLQVVTDFCSHLEKRTGRSTPPRCMLTDSETNEQIELPPQFFPVLRQAAEAMRRGQIATIIPRETEVTTQEAADYLGVSRSTIVRILQRGELPYVKINRHRRIRFTDLETYRNMKQQRQFEALADIPIDGHESETPDADHFRNIRKTVAAHHGATRQPTDS